MNHTDAAVARWDAYWKHGFLTSCADAFDGNYGGSIRDHWSKLFDLLEAEQCVLDICTGNGAVAALAAQHALDVSLPRRVVGVDLAAIEPQRALKDQPHLLEHIEFLPRTPANATGLAPASVDLVCGQYALEYTPRQATVAEIARVTRPGGTASFILHHDQSVIMLTTREELGHRERLAQCDDILEAAFALGNIVASASTAEQRQALGSNPAAEAARNRLNAVAAILTEAAQNSTSPEILLTVMGYAKKIYSVAGGGNLTNAQTLVTRGRDEIAANFARLDDLCAAALTRVQLETLADNFVREGFESPELDSLIHDNLLIGWTLTTRRRAT
ncbi:MAG: class I SAM-dependent methyltransferase [Gammaproteobacteria bacterium]